MFGNPDYLKIIVTIALAVCGWVIAHWFTTKRDQLAKKREITVKYLIDAYRFLAAEASQRRLTKEQERRLEEIVADIQLFGSPEQIALVKSLTDNMVRKGTWEYDDLINNLRNDLRKQLGLAHIQGNIMWLRCEGGLDTTNSQAENSE